MAKVFLRKKLILRCGYELNMWAKANCISKWKRYLIFIYSFLAYRIADAVVVTSNEAWAYILEHFDVGAHVIGNAIDTDRFRELGKERYLDRVLYVGRLDKDKGIGKVTKNWRSSVFLDIVSNSKLPEGLIFNDKVKFLGKFNNEDLPGIYNKYKIMINCSPYEGCCKAILEAEACGCAVYRGIDAKALIDIVEEKLKERIKSSREYVVKNFDKKEVIRQWKNVINSLCSY